MRRGGQDTRLTSGSEALVFGRSPTGPAATASTTAARKLDQLPPKNRASSNESTTHPKRAS